jgi:hypothetical protein
MGRLPCDSDPIAVTYKVTEPDKTVAYTRTSSATNVGADKELREVPARRDRGSVLSSGDDAGPDTTLRGGWNRVPEARPSLLS